jgi:hypothetical protein
MTFKEGSNDVCTRCGLLAPFGQGIHFHELTGAPFICSKCLGESLGLHLDWAADAWVGTPQS